MAKPRKNQTPVKRQTHGRHGKRMTRRVPIQAPPKQRRYVSYIFGIRKVRTCLRPKFGMSVPARHAMSSIVKYLCDRIIDEGGKLMLREHRKILMPRDIKSAVRLLLPRALAKYALSKDNKALNLSKSK